MKKPRLSTVLILLAVVVSIALAVVLTQCAPDRSPYWDKEAS